MGVQKKDERLAELKVGEKNKRDSELKAKLEAVLERKAAYLIGMLEEWMEKIQKNKERMERNHPEMAKVLAAHKASGMAEESEKDDKESADSEKRMAEGLAKALQKEKEKAEEREAELKVELEKKAEEVQKKTEEREAEFNVELEKKAEEVQKNDERLAELKVGEKKQKRFRPEGQVGSRVGEESCLFNRHVGGVDGKDPKKQRADGKEPSGNGRGSGCS